MSDTNHDGFTGMSMWPLNRFGILLGRRRNGLVPKQWCPLNNHSYFPEGLKAHICEVVRLWLEPRKPECTVTLTTLLTACAWWVGVSSAGEWGHKRGEKGMLGRGKGMCRSLEGGKRWCGLAEDWGILREPWSILWEVALRDGAPGCKRKQARLETGWAGRLLRFQ